ncbi:hypothetical protein [Streptomyces wuyuanensis]|uniref:Uncharacterized protein n=1 Tax=Streptomyces wuyuanensis TaxID=1196353 RepID=A0A1G9YZ89_9ACTN|nr:hypothetical protein [Streptomyces wuyuanensis]SDN14380.1 hypothetical protein SAMN05444921_12042 [Streptomyces wuyuanensis]
MTYRTRMRPRPTSARSGPAAVPGPGLPGAAVVSVSLSAAIVLLPVPAASAVPRPAAVPVVVPQVAGTGEEWTPTTDAPSGVTAELPGRAEGERTSVPVGGEPVSGRVYGVETGEAFVGFAVFDTPGTARDLRASLKGFLDAYERESGETLRSTDVRSTTVDGRPALDARLSSSDDMAGGHPLHRRGRTRRPGGDVRAGGQPEGPRSAAPAAPRRHPPPLTARLPDPLGRPCRDGIRPIRARTHRARSAGGPATIAPPPFAAWAQCPTKAQMFL